MSEEAALLLSATQINSWRDCQRLWGWKYIARLQTPQSPAALLGDEVDSGQLQPYLRDGRPFDFTKDSGYIAASILAYLPPSQHPGLEVQRKFVMASPSFETTPFGYQGFVDLWLPKGGMPGIDDGPVVSDFKTTSDFKWAKTEKTLATDVQANLYAMNALLETGERKVNLVWLYMRTRGARAAKRVHLRVDADHVAEQFGRIDETGQTIFKTRKASVDEDAEKYVLALEPNAETCDKYGGCPFRDRCNLTPKQRLDFNPTLLKVGNTVSTSTLMANLRARAGLANGAAAAQPPAFAGINPPEKDLPPPPAPEVVTTPLPVDLVSVAEPAPAKKAGRPPGSKNKKTSEEVVLAGLEKTAEASAALIASVPSDEEDHCPSPEAVLACIRTLIRYARTVR